MQTVVMIGIAGLIGTLARYGLATAIDARMGSNFPFGTVAVNLVGSFVIGFLFFAFAGQFLASPDARAAVFIGLLGGFTTFSSFGLQTFELLRTGQVLLAGLNVAVTNIGGLLLVWVGYVLSRMI